MKKYRFGLVIQNSRAPLMNGQYLMGGSKLGEVTGEIENVIVTEKNLGIGRLWTKSTIYFTFITKEKGFVSEVKMTSPGTSHETPRLLGIDEIPDYLLAQIKSHSPQIGRLEDIGFQNKRMMRPLSICALFRSRYAVEV
jgi:hypothetical protein